MIILKQLTIKYLCDFKENARPLDLQEVLLSSGQVFEDTPLRDLIISNAIVAIDTETNEVYAIGGIIEKEHTVWMLCTYAVEKNPIKFLKFSKRVLKDALVQYDYLTNKVWIGNELHTKWLSWLGAKFGAVSNDGFQEFTLGGTKGRCECVMQAFQPV